MSFIGQEIHNFATEIFPFNRSLTGEGVRDTLLKIQTQITDLKIDHYPSGKEVFDWVVPKEWKVSEAFIISPEGKKICNFSDNNLHLVGYSVPYRGKLSLNDLQPYLYSIPDQPDAIPYITSYYEPRWGFCLTHNQRVELSDGVYEIVVDTSLFDGVMNFGELLIPGKSEKEIFLSTYICHPSMANNEISGPSVTTFLSKWIKSKKNREYSYRIIFIPETIGSISYIAHNLKTLKEKVFAGFNITCIGDDRCYSFLPSRDGNTISDVVAKHILKHTDKEFLQYSWLDRGSDERQYCSPGVDLPISSIMRSKYGEYPEYHTSLDNLISVVTPEGLNGGYWAIRNSIEALENNSIYKVKMFCEPQLGKRGLYPTLSNKRDYKTTRTLTNFISYCNSKNTLIDIAEIIGVPVWELYDISKNLEVNGIIEKC